MAQEQRKKEDLYIKPKRRAKNFFITSSAKMDDDKGVTKTTISSSVFTKMSQSFSKGDHLLDDGIRNLNGSVLYMLQEMQQDIDDVYNEVSASAFEASYFPFATIDSGSFGVISSSLVPDKDDKYNLGSSVNEWHTSYMLTASIGGGIFTSASLAAGGGNADFSSVGENIIPDGDNTRDLGSSTKEFRNLYIDGTAYIDTLAGTTLTKPIRTVLNQVTAAPKNNVLDASDTDVFEFNSSKAITIDLIAPSFPGQEITIMNINSGAVTITRSNKGKQTSIYGAKNLTINQHESYKFIVNSNQIWYIL